MGRAYIGLCGHSSVAFGMEVWVGRLGGLYDALYARLRECTLNFVRAKEWTWGSWALD